MSERKAPVTDDLIDKDRVNSAEHLFDGSDYVPARDNVRLSGQIQRVFNDEGWQAQDAAGDSSSDRGSRGVNQRSAPSFAQTKVWFLRCREGTFVARSVQLQVATT